MAVKSPEAIRRRRDRKRELRRDRRARGVCLICERPVDGTNLCSAHQKQANQTAFVRRVKARQQGTCRDCSNPTHHGFVRCDVCMRKAEKYRPDYEALGRAAWKREMMVGSDRRRNGGTGRGLLWALKERG